MNIWMASNPWDLVAEISEDPQKLNDYAQYITGEPHEPLHLHGTAPNGTYIIVEIPLSVHCRPEENCCDPAPDAVETVFGPVYRDE